MSINVSIPKQISHYQIVRKLGAGGMGEVYLAQDTRLGRKVAIKFLGTDYIQEPEYLRRFQQEARMISILNHPNIVTIYDIGEIDLGHFLIMEFIEGLTLKDLYNSLPNLDLIKKFGIQIAKGLAAAHKKNIIHRDIKPENIMIRDDDYIKILDFGLAKLSSTTNKNSILPTVVKTQTGVILGTVAYMSPEQTQAEAFTTATDIFSLGIIFYELATAEHPFEATSMVAYLHKIYSQQAITPSKINTLIPARLDKLIMQMLEKEPSLRPNATEIIDILNDCFFATTPLELKPLSQMPEKLVTKNSIKNLIVGREKELEFLQKSFENLAKGSGSWVSVVGEVGTGKTSLVNQFLETVSNNYSDVIIARGHSSERLAGTEAYFPFLEIMQTLLNTNRDSSAHIMKKLAPTWYSQVTANLGSETLTTRPQEKAISQEKLKRELANFLQELSNHHPLILFLDDLHWADASTIELIAYLGSLKFNNLRVLFITTYRFSDMSLAKHPFLQVKLDLQFYNVYQELTIDLLTQDDITKYLSLTFPQNNFPKDLAQLIFTKTEGNPLFMSDLICYLVDCQAISVEEGKAILSQSLSVISQNLPNSIRNMIEKKLDKLNEDERKILSVASVQGVGFDSAVLAKVLNLDPADVEEGLERLEKQLAVIQLVEEKEFPDRSLNLHYRFAHILYQNNLFSSLKPSRRASFASTIAQTLGKLYGKKATIIAAELGHLYEMGREFSQAVDYYIVAAQNAVKTFAHTEAIALIQRAINLLPTLSDESEKSKKELRLQLMLGISLSVTKGYAAVETGETFHNALKLCQEIGEDKLLFPITWGLEIYYTVSTKYHIAYTYAQQMLEIGQASQSSILLIGAYYALGVLEHFFGNLTISKEHLEKSISLHDKNLTEVYISTYGLDPGIYSRALLVRSFLLLGYPEKAKQQLQEVLEISKATTNPRNIARATMFAANTYQFLQDAQTTKQLTEQSISYCQEHGILQEKEWMIIIQGWAMAAQGQLEDGIAQMQKMMASLKERQMECTFSAFYALLAELLLNTNKFTETLAVVDEALELINRIDERFYEAEFYRIKGNVLAKQAENNPELLPEAENSFFLAIKIADRQQAKAWKLKASIGLFHLWSNQAQKSKAIEMLKAVYLSFTEGFETPDLLVAKQLLNNFS